MHKKHHIKHKSRIIVSLIILITIVTGVSFKLIKRFDMVNKQVYRIYEDDLRTHIEQFHSTYDILNYIKDWGYKQGLISIMDDSNNIIFQRPATAGNEGNNPTVVCVDVDYLTIDKNISDISTALYIAAAQNDQKLKGGAITVIFLNDDKNLNIGARDLDPEYIPSGASVFYLSSNKDSYSSRSSFARSVSNIHIDNDFEERTCDTMLKIKIEGVNMSSSGDAQDSQPPVIQQLQSILTRLRTKSTQFEISDISLSDNGNLKPTSLELNLLINNYDLEAYKKWLDDKSNKFEKKYKKNNPNISYTYEVITEQGSLPTYVYGSECIKSLSNILYTIKNGDYKFEDEKDNDLGNKNIKRYGKNIITNISTGSDSIDLKIVTDAIDEAYVAQIQDENSTAAVIFNSTYTSDEVIPAFNNKDHSLNKMLAKAYTKVNLFTDRNITLPEEWDESFTTCSYLNLKNDKLNTLHISISENDGPNISNVLLNYHNWPEGKWI